MAKRNNLTDEDIRGILASNDISESDFSDTTKTFFCSEGCGDYY